MTLTRQGVRDPARRGSFTAATEDADLLLAARELASGGEALRLARMINDQRDRREAIRSAVAKLALADRAIRTVIERREA